jgi:hypothetical protein
MIYWYTGQPGHGKTLHAIQRALEFKAQGRAVYVCNVRDFDYEKTGCLPMTPEQFRDWMNFLPDGAVCLVDEAYEHDMLPKRSAAQKLPAHVERLATHRHKGLDFIFVCQSPDKQIDIFVHDLIERHTHVRRKFGTQFVELREFDRFERNPEKAHPLVSKRTRLPKKVFGLYKSTEMDTTERRIPWYFFAFALGVPLVLFMMYYTFGDMKSRLGGGKTIELTQVPVQAAVADGAQATAANAANPMSALEYAEQFVPRIASQPWSASFYDGALPKPNKPPRIFCAISHGGGLDGNGVYITEPSCTCLTEQGTHYSLDIGICQIIAENGQYEPYYNMPDSTTAYDGSDLSRQQYRKLESNANARQIQSSDQTILPASGAIPKP